MAEARSALEDSCAILVEAVEQLDVAAVLPARSEGMIPVDLAADAFRRAAARLM